MSMILKPLNLEISVTTADTVYNSLLVRAYASTKTLVTISDAVSANTIATFTMPAESIELIEKDKLNTISANNAILCTPVSYKS
jgi:hypothetical protein